MFPFKIFIICTHNIGLYYVIFRFAFGDYPFFHASSPQPHGPFWLRIASFLHPQDACVSMPLHFLSPPKSLTFITNLPKNPKQFIYLVAYFCFTLGDTKEIYDTLGFMAVQSPNWRACTVEWAQVVLMFCVVQRARRKILLYFHHKNSIAYFL